MNFSEVFIRRPVLAIVVSLLILLLGAQGASNLSIRQYPKVDETVITITTTYAGANATMIQGFITTPVAQAVASTENADYITSSSAQGRSTVVIHMRLGTNPDTALTEVISKTQQVRRQLPTDAEQPIITKGTGQNFGIMYLSFLSKVMTPQQITEYLVRVVQPRLATIPGVAEAQLMGAQRFAMRIWLDPILLASRGVTASDVVAAIRRNNMIAAPGRTESKLYSYSVEINSTIQTPEVFGDLPVRGTGEDIVRLRDVAKIELGSADVGVRVRANGRDGIFFGIYPTPDANPLDMAKAVHAEIPRIKAELPPGLEANLLMDATATIQESIFEVYKAIAEAVIIVILVIFLFIGSVRAVIIPILTIPLSLIGVCFFLFVLGYSFNLLTLLAMVLAIGLVVDDAIVVVENVHRHIEKGKTPLDAASIAMKELFHPIVAMTVTLAAVYAPIAFTRGLTGALFREFAFALAGAVIISGIVALTLSPMLAARLLRASHSSEDQSGRVSFADRVDRGFSRLASGYGVVLDKTLHARGAVLLTVLVILGTVVVLFSNTRSELAPSEDEGIVFNILQGPRYATPDYMDVWTNKIPGVVGEHPAVRLNFTMSGGGGRNTAVFNFILKPWTERKEPIAEVIRTLQGKMASIAGVDSFMFSRQNTPGSGGGMPIQFVVRTIASPADVYQIAEEIKAKAMASGKFLFVQNSMNYDLPSAHVDIDRARAASLGISVADIGETLSVLLSEGLVSRFALEGRSYDVIPQAIGLERLNPDSLGRFYVRSQNGGMVPLSALINVGTTSSPASIDQFNQLNSATLSAQPAIGTTNDEGLEAFREIAAQIMPDGFFEDFTGESRLSIQERNTLAFTFGFAVLIIYLVLAAQFESFRDPFIIMMAVPLSVFGALIPLNLGVTTLNIYSQVGLVTLIGLITKHGILMVEFANARKAEGASLREAIEQAAMVRLRPILMTTAAMVLGVLPLVLAQGPGANARLSMGVVVMAGMSIGTIFTLFVVPTFYTLLSKPLTSPKSPNHSPGLTPVGAE